TAWLLRVVRNMKSVLCPERGCILEPELTAAEYEEATLALVRLAQNDAFQDEIECLKNKSKIAPLCPVYDTDGHCLRVGGRLRKANIPLEAKYQLILPADHCVTRLLAADIHSRNAHCGREHLVSEMRQKYWPVRARIVAKRVIFECFRCRRQRVKPVVVKMADLPGCRLSVQSGAFYNTGVDYFGPMLVKSRRNTVKRWGCLFTCLATRAVHIELADSLETDDFLLCLRNFIGRRGRPHAIYSDNGTNFTGADSELKQCLDNLNQSQISEFLAPQGIQWYFNPPQAPHHGGAWEILVKSAKRALRSILSNALVTDSVL
ncbi:MAG: hypothetical protein MJA29_01495, partial [Candidatus Omnitrophica bacterium]|nr:hypothetical protein [Candidatus Omnitrophota bacterium]